MKSMSQRHFLIYSGISCSAIAIGSVGPWASGFLGYSGISGYGGILVLLGAGFAALALWRWTISRRRAILIAVQVIGFLCIVVASYAIYHVIYDTYAHVDDSGLDQIGWGVLLTLAGAIALMSLSVFQYRQDRLAEDIPLGWLKIVLLASAVTAVAMVPLAVSAVSSDSPTYEWDLFAGESASPIPPFALKMVKAKAEGTIWEAWLFGNRERENCLGIKTMKVSFPSEEGAVGNEESATCGIGVPPRYWEQVLEDPFGGQGNVKSILVFLVRREVSSLDVLTGRAPEVTWTHAGVRVFPKHQASTARLAPNIGYAIATVSGPACVRQVMAFDSNDERLATSPYFPCKLGARPSSAYSR
jgi:hypothetical protein